jgi:acyl carrier protein
MTQTAIMPTLIRLMAEQFGMEPGQITADSRIAEFTRYNDWNPGTHLGLLIRLEEEFGVQLDEAAGLAGSVAEIAAAIEQAQTRSLP